MLFRILLLSLTLAMAGAVTACDAPPEAPLVPPELEEMEAESVVYQLSTTLTKEGVREAIVQGDTAFFFPDSTVVLLWGHVRLTAFHEESGLQKAAVTSDRGRLDTRSNAMIAWGNAVLEVADGRRISSVEIHYEPERNRIWSDSASVLEEADGTVLEGTSFTSDLEFTRLRVANPQSRGGVIRFE